MPAISDTTRTKGIHVKMDRETHAYFKARLAHLGLSMQEAFEEFARLVGSGSLSANRMMETLVKRRVNEEIREAGVRPIKHSRRRVRELDTDTLYDLINEGTDSDEGTQPGGHHEVA